MADTAAVAWPEIEEEVNRCSRCGACLAACPLFEQRGREQFGPRGKVELVRRLAGGEQPITRGLARVLDFCLLCGSCTEACPNGVRVDVLVAAARAQVYSKLGCDWFYRFLLGVLGDPGRLERWARRGRLYQKSGLPRLLQASRWERWWPVMAGREVMLPPLAALPFQRPGPRPPHPVQRVAYFPGCATTFVLPQVGQHLVAVLGRHGVEVGALLGGCCGLPAYARGDREGLERTARRVMAQFQASGCSRLVVDCASCGHMLQEYGPLLGTAEARDFASRVVDASVLLTELDTFPAAGLGALPLRLTYHDPCHLRRGQGVEREPRQLLRAIPGVELVEMAQPERCCGAAGCFKLDQRRLSLDLGRQKAEMIRATGAQVVVTGCPSCRWQLAEVAAEAGLAVAVWHPLEVLGRAYAGAAQGFTPGSEPGREGRRGAEEACG